MTILGLDGSGLTEFGKDSHVLRPMMTGWLKVWRLKCCMSSGSCHGMAPSFPIMPLEDCANIIFK